MKNHRSAEIRNIASDLKEKTAFNKNKHEKQNAEAMSLFNLVWAPINPLLAKYSCAINNPNNV